MRHSLLVESKPSAVNDICGRILSQVEQSGYSREDVFAVHLAIEEAFVNAVKHGNKMDASRTVKIEYTAGPEEIEIWLTDEGAGFDPDSVPDPRSGQNIYKPEGRGLLLIRSYMDEVSFNERGNSIRMVRYRHRPRALEDEGVEGT
ncbi:MAG: ATP-binding protein [Phycisphaerales bacterium]|nr:MAG: ATP-binding protein [Phycisphaerales bacterium]